ncbi:MAG: HAMP domain-containing sensor histidine kinase [Proteobacteria bacterium]|nr:HAMP domain-containing sensor histidine kinase [Pseudomonadota bacterium]
MAVTDPILWPRIVRRYTLVLVTLVALLGLATTGYVFWIKDRSERSLRLINDYHLDSAFHCLGAQNELQDMLTRSALEAAGVKEAEQSRFMGHGHDHSLATSFHVLRQQIGEVVEHQRRFADPQFALLVERLVRGLTAVETVFGKSALDEATVHRETDRLVALLTILAQLKKLHTVAYDDLLAERQVHAFRDDLVFLTSALLVFLIGYFCIRVWRRAIDNVVEAQRVAEIGLRLAKEQAEEANNAKSEFLAHMSHELRTPLNAIIGFSDIMRSETLGPVGSLKYREYSNDINEAGTHLLNLINNILDLSKIEAEMEEVHEENLEVRGAINATVMLVRQRAQKNNIGLKLEIGENLPDLCADARKLKQILTNLLTNAIKYTKPGGTVTVRAWCRREGGYVFQIADTGIGIAPNDIPKALAQFGQVNSGLNRKYEGTGLGLPLTKALVELHGGSLDLQSEVGTGTTVTVRFPTWRIVSEKAIVA